MDVIVQTQLLQFIEQSLVANLQLTRRSLSVPVRSLELVQNHASLCMPRSFARRFFQGPRRGQGATISGTFRESRDCLGSFGCVSRRQIMGSELLIAQSHNLSCDILQFPDISRPGMPQQQRRCGFADFWFWSSEQGGVFLEEEFQQRGNVFFSFSQRRQPQVYPIDPVIKIVRRIARFAFRLRDFAMWMRSRARWSSPPAECPCYRVAIEKACLRGGVKVIDLI